MTDERILIIDDNPEITRFLVDLLEPLDYRLSSANKGREGLTLALRNQPDLILLDLNLPDISGIQVLEELHNHYAQPSVILMTLHGSESVAADALRMGVRDYIIKPFDIDELLAAIERALEAGRLRRERERLIAELSETNRRLKLRMRELSTLQAISRSMASLMSREELLRRVMDAAIYITGADVSAVFLRKAADGRLRLEAVRSGKHYQTDLAPHVPDPDAYATDVAESGRASGVTPSGERATFVTYLGQRAEVLLYTPIRLREHTLGVLGVAYASPDHRLPQEVQSRLAALADQVAVALENARLHETLRDTVALQTLQETVTTLAHYVNNPLQVLMSLSDLLKGDSKSSQAAAILEEEVRKIAAVISVLKEITSPESTIYLGSTQMLDVEAKLKARLEDAAKPNNSK